MGRPDDFLTRPMVGETKCLYYSIVGMVMTPKINKIHAIAAISSKRSKCVCITVGASMSCNLFLPHDLKE